MLENAFDFILILTVQLSHSSSYSTSFRQIYFQNKFSRSPLLSNSVLCYAEMNWLLKLESDRSTFFGYLHKNLPLENTVTVEANTFSEQSRPLTQHSSHTGVSMATPNDHLGPWCCCPAPSLASPSPNSEDTEQKMKNTYLTLNCDPLHLNWRPPLILQ